MARRGGKAVVGLWYWANHRIGHPVFGVAKKAARLDASRRAATCSRYHEYFRQQGYHAPELTSRAGSMQMSYGGVLKNMDTVGVLLSTAVWPPAYP